MYLRHVLLSARRYSTFGPIGGPSSLDWQQVRNIQRQILDPLSFRLGLLKQLPMGFLAGLHVTDLSAEHCGVAVKQRFLNNNPFGSTYWAVLGMAAELSSGLLVTQYTRGQPRRLQTLVAKADAQFHRRAEGVTHFHCESGRAIAAAVETVLKDGSAQRVHTVAKGVDRDGQAVADFSFTWSIKELT